MPKREWLREIRKAKKESADGDTRCRGCGGEGLKMLVLGQLVMGETVPAARVRLCEPCVKKWMARDPELMEKLKDAWEDLA